MNSINIIKVNKPKESSKEVTIEFNGDIKEIGASISLVLVHYLELLGVDFSNVEDTVDNVLKILSKGLRSRKLTEKLVN